MLPVIVLMVGCNASVINLPLVYMFSYDNSLRDYQSICNDPENRLTAFQSQVSRTTKSDGFGP
ncbi:protein of unknown function [Nitratireductor aquimarinus]